MNSNFPKQKPKNMLAVQALNDKWYTFFREIKLSKRYYEIRKFVFARDKYHCVLCNKYFKEYEEWSKNSTYETRQKVEKYSFECPTLTRVYIDKIGCLYKVTFFDLMKTIVGDITLDQIMIEPAFWNDKKMVTLCEKCYRRI